MKRAIITAALIAASLIGTVSAATGSTSTGSTSTGSTAPTLTCQTGLPCAGGPVRAYNYTLGAFDLYPQCFPWVFRADYLKGNIFDMYKNQESCRAQRLIDFRF